MSDLRQRISDVLCNRLADLDVRGGRYVADNLAETLLALPDVVVVDLESAEARVFQAAFKFWLSTFDAAEKP